MGQNQIDVGMYNRSPGALPQVDVKTESDHTLFDWTNTETQLQKPTPLEISSSRQMLTVVASIEATQLPAENDINIDSIQFQEESVCDNAEMRKPQASAATITPPNITQTNNDPRLTNTRTNISSTPVASQPPNETIAKDISKSSRRNLFDPKFYNEAQLCNLRKKQPFSKSAQLDETKKHRSSTVIQANPRLVIAPETLFPLTDDPNKIESTSLRSISNSVFAENDVELVPAVTPKCIQQSNKLLDTSNCNLTKKNGESNISMANNAIIVAQTSLSVGTNAYTGAAKSLPIAKKIKSPAKNRISKVKNVPLKTPQKIAKSKPKPVKKEPKPKSLKSYEIKLPYPIDKENYIDLDEDVFELLKKNSVPSTTPVEHKIPIENRFTSNDSNKIIVNAGTKLAKKRSAPIMPNKGDDTTIKKSKITGPLSTIAESILLDTPETPGRNSKNIYMKFPT